MKNKRATGADYEKKAAAYLESKGYEILEFNFHCRMGEIDLVAKDGEYLVFVEVKYRDSEKKGHPLEAVSAQKQRTISKCAMYYMTKNGLSYMPVRFDVVGILGNDIQLIQNAFDFIM
ncbi:MAG: YraN family protein [Tyzzerella sp.]|nr:YraN family protein [Tyzzerella sp.]